jgi:hypothetical protein
VAADWIPYKKHFRRTGGLDLTAWFLVAWMLAGLKEFEEVADRWEGGIVRTEDMRTFHTLNALGGRRISCILSHTMPRERRSGTATDFCGFPKISLALHRFFGFERFWVQNVGRLLNPYGILWHPGNRCKLLWQRIGHPIY